MRKNAPKPYRRLDKADQTAIERGLDKRKPEQGTTVVFT